MAATAAQFAATRFCRPPTTSKPRSPAYAARAAAQGGENWASPRIEIPEEYGGMGMDKITSTVITDHLSVLASFSTAFGAQIGIGTLPLVWYGTEEQKQQYLPKLATAEWIGAYALSEASSGSDAMNVRTRATLSADGQTLRAERREDVDHQLPASPVSSPSSPKSMARSSRHSWSSATAPGLKVGAEEHKLGIRGSSTCPLVLAGLQGSGSEPARRTGQGPPHRVQRAERGPLQAWSCMRRRSAPCTRTHDPLCKRAQGFRKGDRRVRTDPAQRSLPLPRASMPRKAWPIAPSA